MSRNSRGKNRLSALDKRILNRLQEDIPFAKRPWKTMAGGLNTREDTLLRRIAFLKKKGIIRRISAVFSPNKVNFVSTLAAIKAHPARIDRAVKKINLYPEVTHNYARDGEYDIWFTLVARNKKRIRHIMRRLKSDK